MDIFTERQWQFIFWNAGDQFTYGDDFWSAGCLPSRRVKLALLGDLNKSYRSIISAIHVAIRLSIHLFGSELLVGTFPKIPMSNEIQVQGSQKDNLHVNFLADSPIAPCPAWPAPTSPALFRLPAWFRPDVVVREAAKVGS